MRRLPTLLLLTWLLAGCTTSYGVAPATTRAAIATQNPVALPSASRSVNASEDTIPGPAGMTLAQEVGAVMMVRLPASPAPALLEDWHQHQFGGLYLASDDRSQSESETIRALIQSIRAIMDRPLLVATEKNGTATTASAIESEMASIARALKGDGFDIDLAPSGAGRSTPQLVGAAIAGLHSGGVFAALREFSSDGNGQSVFRAALTAHVDIVVVRASAPGDVHSLRTGLGFQGVTFSDEIGSGDAATTFLERGGDMVRVGPDVTQADDVFDAIHAAVLEGRYPRAQLDASVQKLLNLRLRFMP